MKTPRDKAGKDEAATFNREVGKASWKRNYFSKDLKEVRELALDSCLLC